MPGQSTLAGLLNSSTVKITAAQLLNLVNAPIVLCAPGSPGKAALLKSLVVSLEFGSVAFAAQLLAGAVVFYGGPSRLAAFGSAGSLPGFAISAVANASGGNTVYTGTIGGANNAFAGLYGDVNFCTHAANNGRFVCTASTPTTITLANAVGVAEAAPAAATCLVELPGGAWGCGLGGGSDLTTSLVAATASQVFGYEVSSWNFPAVEIAGFPILLGNPLPTFGLPANFSAGDSSLLITAEFLQVSL